MAESFVDSFKTELITDRVWRTRSQLELAIVAYVGWFNHQRLHSELDDIPPAEHETLHEFRYAAARHQGQDEDHPIKRGNQSTRSPRNPGQLKSLHCHGRPAHLSPPD